MLFNWKEEQVGNGERTTIRPLQYADLKSMSTWPRTNRPEEAPYQDFPRDWANLEAWFSSRTRDPYKRTWTVFDEDQNIIGRLGITLVDLDHKEGLLSIRLRGDKTGMGYGPDCLPPLLDYWFRVLQMDVMALDVSILNQGAIHLYEKLGFRLVGYHWVPISNKHIVKDFSDSGFVRYLDMHLDREDWLKAVK